MRIPRRVRIAIGASAAIWVAFAVFMWVMKGVFFSTLFILLLMLLLTTPPAVDSWVTRRWFFALFAPAAGLATTGCLHAFRWSGSLPQSCDHLFVPLGIFVAVSFVCVGFLESRKRRTGAPGAKVANPEPVSHTA